MVDTPELFGGELRILAAVDFRDGKIIRWVDYWDAASYDDELYVKFRTPGVHFPRDLKDAEVPTQAAPELVTAATALQQAFAAGDAPAAADLLGQPLSQPAAARTRAAAATAHCSRR